MAGSGRRSAGKNGHSARRKNRLDSKDAGRCVSACQNRQIWTGRSKKEAFIMDDGLKIKMYSFTLDCRDPHELAKFYAALLNWEVIFATEEWACVGVPGSDKGAYPGILFQGNPLYERPVWPDEPEEQQQMAHLDFAVNDLEAAVEYAIHCGATVAEQQFSDHWRVMFDPAGHPFCLCEMKSVMESAGFALL
jgi:predicted enzyme related to lactoylglutathione lyase